MLFAVCLLLLSAFWLCFLAFCFCSLPVRPLGLPASHSQAFPFRQPSGLQAPPEQLTQTDARHTRHPQGPRRQPQARSLRWSVSSGSLFTRPPECPPMAGQPKRPLPREPIKRGQLFAGGGRLLAQSAGKWPWRLANGSGGWQMGGKWPAGEKKQQQLEDMAQRPPGRPLESGQKGGRAALVGASARRPNPTVQRRECAARPVR